MSDPSRLPRLDHAQVERALRHLPLVEREALLLKSRKGLSYAEIGVALGLTPAEAEARVAAALVRLHARLVRPRRRPWWRLW